MPAYEIGGGSSAGDVATAIAAAAPRALYDPWLSGQRYDASTFRGGDVTATAVVANTMYAVKVVPVALTAGGTITINAADIRLSVAGSASTKGRVALYQYNAATGKPDSCALIAQSVDLALDAGANTTVNDGTFAATLTDLTPVWAVFWGNGAPTLVTLNRMGNRTGISTATQGAVINPGWSVGSQTFTPASSVFPSTLPTGFAQSSIAPSITLKVA